MSDLVLVNVYEVSVAAQVLFDLLKERDNNINISHVNMPNWDEHVKFIESKPYSVWYLLKINDDYVGSIYLSKMDEIGVFLFSKQRGKGLGKRAIVNLMQAHPRGRFIANINPHNQGSISMFERMGFRHIQNTYELRN